MSVQPALIIVLAVGAISRITNFAAARKRAMIIGATCIRVTIVIEVSIRCAFINIFAVTPIASETIVATTNERAMAISASRILVAIMIEVHV